MWFLGVDHFLAGRDQYLVIRLVVFTIVIFFVLKVVIVDVALTRYGIVVLCAVAV